MVLSKKMLAAMAACVLSAGIAGTSQAAVAGPFTGSIALETTNWNHTVSIPKFDTLGGIRVLDSVTFTIHGSVEGDAFYESTDNLPATVTIKRTGTLTLQRPDTSTLVVVVPLFQQIDNVPAFDLSLDFDGPSGQTYANLVASASQSASSSSAADLALFTGIGNIVLPVSAVGASSQSASGNILGGFDTLASASVDVTYTYSLVPEPASLSLLAVGALGLLRRRRTA